MSSTATEKKQNRLKLDSFWFLHLFKLERLRVRWKNHTDRPSSHGDYLWLKKTLSSHLFNMNKIICCYVPYRHINVYLSHSCLISAGLANKSLLDAYFLAIWPHHFLMRGGTSHLKEHLEDSAGNEGRRFSFSVLLCWLIVGFSGYVVLGTAIL